MQAILTRREREVMQEVMTGAMNKQIAVHLRISEKSVKVHRAHVMRKMQISSAAELVQLCACANLLPGTPAMYIHVRVVAVSLLLVLSCPAAKSLPFSQYDS
jgi:DNA-binding CsgD family transcriptional regulator